MGSCKDLWVAGRRRNPAAFLAEVTTPRTANGSAALWKSPDRGGLLAPEA